MSDIYQKIADEEGVSRNFVKIHAMATFYCMGRRGKTLVELEGEVRAAVRIAKVLTENTRGKEDETPRPHRSLTQLKL